MTKSISENNNEKLFDHYICEIINHEFANIPQAVKEWISANEIHEKISQRVNIFFNRNFKDNFKIEEKNNDDISEVSETDFDTHITELGNGKFAVTVIETENDFQNDKSRILLIYKNFNMTEISLGELNKIAKRYKVFNPEGIVFYETSINSEENSIFTAEAENISVAGKISNVRLLQVKDTYEKIQVEKIDNMDFYDKYSHEYDLFFKANPFMRNLIIKESFETLNDILTNGYLFKAVIDGQFAGVFAIIRHKTLYYNCYFIREEILFENFRGKNFASSFQRKVIEELNSGEIDFICGSIHSQNKASLRTAISCGRTQMETDYFIRFNK